MTYTMFSDEYFMNEALKEARKARDADEVPVGAIVVIENKIIARAYNQTQSLVDVTAHAEMLAIISAANNLSSKYLHHCTLYVTLEPCVMCGSATAWAQLSRIVFGASDPKAGYSSIIQNILHSRTKVKKGILEQECSELLVDFFKKKR